MQNNKIEKYLKRQKERAKKLYATKHKQGFKTKEDFGVASLSFS